VASDCLEQCTAGTISMETREQCPFQVQNMRTGYQYARSYRNGGSWENTEFCYVYKMWLIQAYLLNPKKHTCQAIYIYVYIYVYIYIL
jgi:hypothetical protein